MNNKELCEFCSKGIKSKRIYPVIARTKDGKIMQLMLTEKGYKKIQRKQNSIIRKTLRSIKEYFR